MHCCLWFRSVFRVRGPWPKRYGYHLNIIIINPRVTVVVSCVCLYVCMSVRTRYSGYYGKRLVSNKPV